MQNGDTVSIKELPLASWLHSQGFKLLNVNILDYPAVITFENSDALRRAKRLWETGQAVGNCNAFYDSERMLLDMVKPSWVWRNRKSARQPS